MKWLILGPEIYFLAIAVLFLILSLMRLNKRRDFSAALFLAGLGVAVTLATVRLEGTFFHGAYRVDLFSQVFKGLVSIGFFLVVCLCSNLNGIHEKRHWAAKRSSREASCARFRSPRWASAMRSSPRWRALLPSRS